MSNKLTISKMVTDDSFIKQAEKTLGSGTQQFLSSVISLYNADPTLQKLDTIKLYNTCLMAAALKLPFNSNLGQAYIIPYKGEPQLQIGWKGFVQLAQRSGQFKTIGVNPVRENEIGGIDPLTGEIIFDFKLPEGKSGETVGYMAYFRLLNGFEKNLFMTTKELESHAKKYSQSYKSGRGVWHDNFEAMANKTVIKLLLNRFAPLSLDMQTAIEVDQQDADGHYADNKPRVELVDAELGTSEQERKEKGNE